MNDFEAFWKEYPRKTAKRAALKVWQKLDFIDQTAALEAITQHKQFWEIKGTELDYIPHASTWLNQGRWEDELVIENKKPATQTFKEKNAEIAAQQLRNMMLGTVAPKTELNDLFTIEDKNAKRLS